MEILPNPLFELGPVAWDAPDPAGYDGLLVGSANVFRHGGEALARYRALPVHAVGDATANAARMAGFTVATAGSGGLQDVLDALSGRHLRLLRLTGREHVALEPPAGITVDKSVVYDSAAQPMAPQLAEMLGGRVVVLLHSAAAARHFLHECKRLQIDIENISLATMSARIAEAAGEGWNGCRIAAETSESALLALAKDMCHDCAS